MGNCGSATKVTTDIWEEYSEQAKLLGCSAVQIVGAAFGAVVDVQTCLELANKADEMSQQMIEFWNEQAADSWATIGPRRLDFNEREEGTLRGTFGRIFISAAPMTEDEVTVSVRKRHGKGKASVTVCKIDPSLRAHKIWDTEFAPGDDNINEKKTRKISGVRGHLLQIHLDGKSFSRDFAYSLQASTVLAVPASGLFTIQQKSGERFLDAHQTSDNDFSVVTRNAQNNDTQQWLLKRVDNTYTIQQKSSKRFLDAHQTTDNDFSVVTRSAQNNDTQQWIIKPV